MRELDRGFLTICYRYLFDTVTGGAFVCLLAIVFLKVDPKTAVLMAGFVLIPLYIAGVVVFHLVAYEMRDLLLVNGHIVLNLKMVAVLAAVFLTVFAVGEIVFRELVLVPFLGR